MSSTARTSVPVLLALAVTLGAGCNMVPQQTLRQSQIRAMQLAGNNRQLSRDNMALKSNLDVSNQRLTNLHSERSLLQQRYVNLLKQQSPLSPEATRQLEALKKKYPMFQFDQQDFAVVQRLAGRAAEDLGKRHGNITGGQIDEDPRPVAGHLECKTAGDRQHVVPGMQPGQCLADEARKPATE